MLDQKTINHFNQIAPTWENKGWVNSRSFNQNIDRFLRSTERKVGFHNKRYKSSVYFGIGTGALFKYLSRYNVAGVDEAQEMLRYCPEGVVQILSKVEKLPFLMDNQFNLSFSRNLLKHCTDPLEAVRSMYQKTRSRGVAVTAESVVLNKEDKDIPTRLVRATDPSHPSFLTLDEVVELFKKAGFSNVEYEIVPYRSAWLKKWLQAEQARNNLQQDILEMYRKAPQGFKDRHNVVIKGGDIISTVPWVLIRAYKD